MLKVMLLLTVAFGLVFSYAGPPVVTNVVANQRAGTKLVDIRYDVSDTENDKLKVRVEISHDGGKTYAVPALNLTGDIGAGITPGPNKLIVWNAGIDWDGEFSQTMRVKVIASDGKGFPGLEWGQEVPPGGFFMGQDGGPEGIGPGRHVNIPWSYWMSKYEITVEQYAEFLNTVLAAGLVRRIGDDIRAQQGSFIGVSGEATLYTLGSDIIWNLNKLTVRPGSEKLPVVLNWSGAAAFATYYGYDLPTDAEWEKAARGPDHDGLGEHRIYPWGNSISGINANINAPQNPFAGRRAPVGSFRGADSPGGIDMANAYGLYDVVGNVAEWTRSSLVNLELYPAIESLNNSAHTYGEGNVLRGGSYFESPTSSQLKCYFRTTSGQSGFRVVRRAQP